jgi:hypothetical protein
MTMCSARTSKRKNNKHQLEQKKESNNMMTTAVASTSESFDDIVCATSQHHQPSEPLTQPRIRRRRRLLAIRMGTLLRQGGATRLGSDACYSVHSVFAFCFITTMLLLLLAATVSTFVVDESNIYNFGGLHVVSAWQSGTMISLSSSSSSSSYNLIKNAPHPCLNPPSRSSRRASELFLHTRFRRLSPSSSSSLWVLSPPAPSSSSSADTTESESYFDSPFEEKSDDKQALPLARIDDLTAADPGDNNQDHHALLQSFLPSEFCNDSEERWKSLPLTRALLENLARNYVAQLHADDGGGGVTISLETVLQVVDQEYYKSPSWPNIRRRNSQNSDFNAAAAVVVIDGISFDFVATGDPADEVVTQILSLAAMYHVPYELTLLLLDGCTAVNGRSSSNNFNNNFALNSVLVSAKEAFAHCGGWNSVTFPKGFALQPIEETTKDDQTGVLRRRRISDNWSRLVSRITQQEMRRRRERAAAAVKAAAAENVEISAIRKAQLARNREEFLSHLHAELSESILPLPEPTTVALFPSNSDFTENSRQQPHKQNHQLVFFPGSVPSHQLSLWKRLRRGVDKSYNLLKKKGRAGFLAYSFFNFTFYSIGLVWQWCGSFYIPFKCFVRIECLLSKIWTCLCLPLCHFQSH